MQRLILAVAILMCLTVPAVAQAPPSQPAPAPAAPGAPGRGAGYVLGPGDVIDVIVLGQAELTQTYTIGPDGYITLPLVGRVRAEGRTVDQLTAELVRLYRRYLKAPAITVRVREFRVERVYVMGQVTRPGEYRLQQGVGLMALIAAAGGLAPKADSKKAVIMRGAETIPVDIDQALLNESRGQLTPLRPNDIVFIPEADRKVTVLGQVARPGTYDFAEGNRLSDALALAGGLTPAAAPRKATLTRHNQTTPVDFDAILKAGNMEANLVLQPGDLIVVPEEGSRVAVLGFVNKPGAYPIKEGDRVLDALVLAGGNAERGDVGNVSLIRQTGGPQPQIVRLDLRRAMQGDMNQNPVLQDRDVVYVAEVGTPDPQKVLPWAHLGLALLRLLFLRF